MNAVLEINSCSAWELILELTSLASHKIFCYHYELHAMGRIVMQLNDLLNQNFVFMVHGHA